MDARFRNVPEALWERVAPLLPKEPPKPWGGRPRVPDRKIFAGVVYRLKTGCQWRALPDEFGSGATCHRRFSQWVEAGVFRRLFREILQFYDVKKGIQWTWSSLDALIVEAPRGGLLRAPTRRTAPRVARRGTS